MTKNMTPGKAYQYFAVLAATVFSVWANWNIIGHVLNGDGTWVYQVLCLIFVDCGLIGWAFYLSDGAASPTQRTIAGAMLGYCFVAAGSGIAGEVWFLVDKQAKRNTAFVADVMPWIIITSVIITLGAGLLCHFSDPAKRRQSIQNKINSDIEEQELNEMEKAAPTFALDMGRAKAQATIAVMRQAILSGLPQLPAASNIIEGSARPVTVPASPDVAPAPPPIPAIFSQLFGTNPAPVEEPPANFTQPRR